MTSSSLGAATANPVRWITAHRSHRCHECRDAILAGDRMGVWDDVTVGFWGLWHNHTIRRYCEDCGHLLEDSLTTTETAE